MISASFNTRSVAPERIGLIGPPGGCHGGLAKAVDKMGQDRAVLVKVDSEYGDRSHTYSGTGRIRDTW